MLKNTEQGYGSGTKLLHWVIGVSVIALLAVGFYMEGMDDSPNKFQIYAIHKAVGMSVLALMLVRFLWRLMNVRPKPLENHKPWEKTLAHAVHMFFYIALIAMPLSGWVMSSAGGYPVSFFGVFTFPDIVEPNRALAGLARNFHYYAGYTIAGVVALHVAGALKHHLVDKDSTLRRMLPFGKA